MNTLTILDITEEHDIAINSSTPELAQAARELEEYYA